MLESVFNFSDHHYIGFSLILYPAGFTVSRPQVPSGWDTSGGIDSDSLLTGLLLAEWLDGGTPLDEQDADLGAISFRSRVTAACNFALPPRRAPNLESLRYIGGPQKSIPSALIVFGQNVGKCEW